ncbi:MAG TPA: CvpA family protein [Bacilli bacterium]
MEFFNTFSFDAIILLVVAISIFTGIYYGIYRQVGVLLKLGLPFVVLYFLFDQFLIIHKKITGLGLFKNSSHRYLINALFVYIIAYALLFFLIGMIYRIFRPSVMDRVLKRPEAYSRLVGGFIGLITGFLISTLLVYFLKPIIGFNYNPPFTKLLIASENRVISLSKLNQYQYVNVEKFQAYDEAIDSFTGRSALDYYTKSCETIQSLSELEEKINHEICPLLSSSSQELLGEDVLESLVSKDGNKRIYQKILEIEKDNESYQLIEASFRELPSKQVYILLSSLLEEEGTFSFPAFMETVESNYEEILSEFTDLKSRKEFENGFASGKYYLENQETFRKYFPGNQNADFVTRVENMETLLESEEFPGYAKSFLESDAENYPLLTEIFRKYLKQEKTITVLPKHLSFAAKIVLAEESKNWFKAPLWEDMDLIKYYLYDAFTSSENRGHKLYSEYFFANYLAAEEGYESFGGAEFSACLEKLQAAVATGIIERDVAERYVANLLLEEDGVLADFQKRKISAPSLYDEILQLENEYLTESLKAELASRCTQ